MISRITFLLLISLGSHAQPGIISTFAGTGISGDSGDGGPATAAKISGFTTGAFDSYGNFYFAERVQHKIRKISTAGIITTIAGNGTSGFSGDGGAANLAKLNNPMQVAVDNSDNVYIADLNNERVRKINTATGIIITVAGNGVTGHSGNGGQATSASLNGPTGVCVDPFGNVYTSEIGSGIIRKINTSGIISTYAGIPYAGTDGGDGGNATSATISSPQGICSDDFGNIFVTTASKVRKIFASSGIIISIAGGTIPGFSGDGGPGTAGLLNSPWSVAVDRFGNIFIADGNNHRIRRVNNYGIITTVVGNGGPGYNGDGISATAAQINEPEGVMLDSCGNIYLSDLFNSRIRKVTFPKCNFLDLSDLDIQSELSVNPNPAYKTITIASIYKINSLTVTDLMGKVVDKRHYADKEKVEFDVAHLIQGVYFLESIDTRGVRTVKRIVKQ